MPEIMEKEKTPVGFYSQTEFISYALKEFQRANWKFPPCNRLAVRPADGWAVVKDRSIIRAVNYPPLRRWLPVSTKAQPSPQA